MKYDFYLGLLIFFAVLLHKIPEGLTIASVMLAAAHRRQTAFLASAAIGVATMLGIRQRVSPVGHQREASWALRLRFPPGLPRMSARAT